MQTKINVGNGEWTLVAGYHGEMQPAIMFFKNEELAVVGERLFAPVVEPDIVITFANTIPLEAFRTSLNTIESLFNGH